MHISGPVVPRVFVLDTSEAYKASKIISASQGFLNSEPSRVPKTLPHSQALCKLTIQFSFNKYSEEDNYDRRVQGRLSRNGTRHAGITRPSYTAIKPEVTRILEDLETSRNYISK